jgi:hypothetical protein
MILNGIAEGISGGDKYSRERKRPDVLSIKPRLGTKCGRSTFWLSAVCSSLHSLESVFRLCAVCDESCVYKSRLVLLSPAAAHGEARGGVGLSLCL